MLQVVLAASIISKSGKGMSHSTYVLGIFWFVETSVMLVDDFYGGILLKLEHVHNNCYSLLLILYEVFDWTWSLRKTCFQCQNGNATIKELIDIKRCHFFR